MNPRREWLAFAAFVAPGLVLFGLFTWWPMIYTGYLSLMEWRLPAPAPSFIGLENFVELGSDPDFWRVLLNTLLYATVVILAAQVLAFGLAALLARPMPGGRLWRSLVLTPYITTPAAAAMVWVLVLDPDYGPLSIVYGALGVEGPRWMSHSVLALCGLMLVGMWKEIGFATVFYVAGRQNLPQECYEASKIDGAGKTQAFAHLTLPLMTPVIFFLILSGFISASKTFDSVAFMSEGGPVYPDSSLFVYHLYQLGFRDYRLGYASAFAVVSFILLGALTALQFRSARRWVQRDVV